MNSDLKSGGKVSDVWGRESSGKMLEARAMQGLLRVATHHGLDHDRLLRVSGWGEIAKSGRFESPDSRIPVDVYLDLYRVIQSTTKDPLLSLRIASQMRIEDIPGLVKGRNEAESIGEMWSLLAQGYNNRIEGVRFLVKDDGRYWQVNYEWPCFSVERSSFDVEVMFLLILMFSRELGENKPSPVSIHFRHSISLALAREIQRVFKCAPVCQSSANAIVFSSSTMSRPLNLQGSWIGGELRLEDEQIETNMTFRERVYNVVSRSKAPRQLSKDGIAKALGLSVRTMQRRLFEEGVTLSKVIDAHLAAEADRLLLDSTLTIAEIGFRLGYSESSAFIRAFRSWKGVAPGEYRRNDRDVKHDDSQLLGDTS